MSDIRAPWTQDVVDGLNRWQRGDNHSFTCGKNSDHVLVATLNGWICPHDDYTQDWAHDFMAAVPFDPEDMLPSLDPYHLCPACGKVPWAPIDGSMRVCDHCGHSWDLFEERERAAPFETLRSIEESL